MKTKGILFIVLLVLTVTVLPLKVSQAGTTWIIETLDSSAHNTSLALDSNDTPHISYYDLTNQDLKYICMSDGVWNAPVTVDSTGDAGRWSSLALDSDDNPHISYEDSVNGDLKYICMSGGVWNAPVTLDSTGSVGWKPSLALDSAGNPHISYYDLTNQDLKYICMSGGVWNAPVTVDSTEVGSYSSLALDSAGNPYISYCDATNWDLKYARLEETADGLVLENVGTWYWTDDTSIRSVAKGDVDADGETEIVTGGYCWAGTRRVAQLCVWDGATLALENVKTWYWMDSAEIWSVAVGDVDGDGQQEIVTGGRYHDSPRDVAQLCVWDGATLALENVKTWYWTGDTYIMSVGIDDVDGDGLVEVVSGGYYGDGDYYAQLCVWDEGSLALECSTTWNWGQSTYINSVVVGNVDGDAKPEIVTGGAIWTTPNNAQLCVWSVS